MREKIGLLVEGGQAGVTPAMAQALGPAGINIQDILAKINERTREFKGIKVPVDLFFDKAKKSVEIKVGIPPTAELVKKEVGLEKCVATPGKEVSGDIAGEQVRKIAGMVAEKLQSKTEEGRIKEVASTCMAMGLTIDGQPAREWIQNFKL